LVAVDKHGKLERSESKIIQTITKYKKSEKETSRTKHGRNAHFMDIYNICLCQSEPSGPNKCSEWLIYKNLILRDEMVKILF
jgi:hypothetical protein